MKIKTIKNRECRMCDGKKFQTVIDFGENPLVNSLLTKEEATQAQPTVPLVVKRCVKCGLVQIKDIVDSQEIYKNVDYLYFSGDMPKLEDYFREYAGEIKGRFLDADGEPIFVVEIGSNDGTMLKEFKPCQVLGIDPASNVVTRALSKGIPTISDFFSARLARSIKREWGKAKVIYGNNCIAHLNNLKDLMEGVVELLDRDGTFIVECNYWGGMVRNKNYALIYHDHFSYFSVKNWIDFAEKYGMYVYDAVVTPAQGGSLRVFMAKKEQQTGDHRYWSTDRLKELFGQEQETKLNSKKTCDVYRAEVLEEASKLHDLVVKLKSEGKKIAGYGAAAKKIAGYGAAAKGFSVLKLAGITGEHIDYFVDDSSAKQGKYTPVTHIPVISRENAESNLPDYFFITAPNYEKVIVEKEAEFRAKGGKFITVDCRVVE